MSLDRLEEFASEGLPEGGDASISVHDLIARGTPVSWDEAVAIVEEMCEVAVARSGSAAPVPALSDVLLDVTGRVAIARAEGEKSPAAAARALHAVLSNADVPVPLRLFVTQSAAPGTHGSLQEFAAGLAYFGRPNRTALIQDVYKRAAALVRAGVEPTLSPPPLPLPEKAAKKESPQSKKSNRRRALHVAAACIAVALAAAAAWAWWMSASRGRNTEPKPVLSQVSAALTDLANQVRERLTPAVSKEPQVPSAPVSTDPRPRPGRRATPAIVPEESPLASRQLSIAQPSTWQPQIAVPAMSIPLTAASPLTVAPVEEPSFDARHVFTKQDADVQPPLLQYPQLAPPLKGTSSRPAPVNSVEVIVAADGTVERARFVAGPIRMMDIMLVGSIKNWKFTPAFRGGEAVRYQTVISWSAVP
jgi:hypothetical protein